MNYVREQWDRSLAALAFLGGLISLLLGWIGTSGTEYVADQIPYVVSGGLLGIFLLGAAAALWISADLRDEWRELHGVRTLLKQHLASGLAPAPGFGAIGNQELDTRNLNRDLAPAAASDPSTVETRGARHSHSAASST